MSGLPLIIYAASNNTNIGTASQRPLTNGTSARITGGTKDQRLLQWFDITTFSQPPAFTFGNVSRTLPDVRAPGTNITDLSIFKNTYFGPEQRLNLQYRIEMFAAFNTPQWGTPGTTVNSGSIGVISSASGSRVIQMALKLLW